MQPASPRVSFERWSRVCSDLGISPRASDYRRVRRAWSGMSRHYHTLTHLDACLREFDHSRDLAAAPAEVELALWFHDAVYRSWRRDNEQRSADLAARVLHSASPVSVERIRQMILATLHHDADLGGDLALVTDIDLSILGEAPGIYAQFERAIRREYWWVPRARYVAGRRKVLEGFLGRPTIYRHDRFREKYESPARANLQAALQKLAA
jgi:predicted metal-dependent HD superfamily phosphohydrolase